MKLNALEVRTCCLVEFHFMISGLFEKICKVFQIDHK